MPKDIGEYIGMQPVEVQAKLKQLYRIIKKAAPKAEEWISYRMPFFNLHGRLLYFAVFKRHIGFYPMRSGITAFKKEISDYKHAAGSVQFPLDKPLPANLITRIVKFRVKENMLKAQLKSKKSR